MDTEQLRTFLEINRTRHFGKAAQNLFLSQSAVSARIQALEEQIGVALFVRNRNDIKLTPSGERLLRHAENILLAWNRAKQDTLHDKYHRDSLRIAGVPNLWDTTLQPWLRTLHHQYSNLFLHCEIEDSNAIIRRLIEGTLDIGFTFDPPQMTHLIVQPVASIALTLVSNHENIDFRRAIATNYVAVDWGASFEILYARHSLDNPPPKIHLPLAHMALDYLLTCGGSSYITDKMAKNALNNQQLFRVVDAPVCERVVYAIHPLDTEKSEIISKPLGLFPLTHTD